MGSRLVLLNLLVVALIVAIIPMTSSVARIVLGLPFVLFFPGYVLNLALFPRKEGMGGIERVVLSFGLSIAVVPLIGSLTTPPWEIQWSLSCIRWLRSSLSCLSLPGSGGGGFCWGSGLSLTSGWEYQAG